MKPDNQGHDLHWALVDSILTRLTYLMGHLGISPQQLIDRLRQISRGKTATKLKARSPGDARTFTEVHSGPEIMRFWYRDIDFVDASGNPKRIPVKGVPISFERLVQRSAPGVRTTTVLADLIAAGAVEQGDDALLTARSFRVTMGAARRAEVALYAVDNLLFSLEANVRGTPASQTLQTEAVCVRFDRKQLPRVRRQLTDLCAADIEQADDWLHQHRLPAGAPPRDAATVIVGIYVSTRESDAVSKKKAK